jgi:hypothetical protein
MQAKEREQVSSKGVAAAKKVKRNKDGSVDAAKYLAALDGSADVRADDQRAAGLRRPDADCVRQAAWRHGWSPA